MNRNKNVFNIAEAKEEVSTAVRCYLLKDENGNYIMKEVSKLPLYLIGPPGVGKTEIVKEIADELGLGYCSFSLTHHTRNSLLGLPVITEMEGLDATDGKYTEYTMSEIIAKVYELVREGYKEGILLLDEFPCMSPTIIPAMLAFLQTKNIGQHTLPEGWTIVLCGNPPEYNDHSITFDTAITDRLRKIEVEWDPEVFLSYAREQQFHESVQSYLELNPASIYKLDEDSLVTCRGWENLSHTIKACEKLGVVPSYHIVRQFIKSDEIATAFINHYLDETGLTADEIRDILGGKENKTLIKKYDQSDSNTKMALVSRLASYMTDDCEGLITCADALDALKQMFNKIVSGNASLPAGIKGCDDIGELPLDVMAECLICPNTNVREVYSEIFKMPFMDQEDAEKGVVRYYMCEMVSDLRERMTSFESADDGHSPNDRMGYEKHVAFIKKWFAEQDASFKKQWKACAKSMDSVFKFLRKLEKGEVMAERFYYFVNRNPRLQKIASEGGSGEYLGYVNAIYGAPA